MRFMIVVLAFVLASISSLGSGAVWASPNSVAILQYHHIGDDTPRVTSVTAEELEGHFAWLKANDFTVMSLADIQAAFADGKTLPERTAAITIDDGWRNVYRNGLAIFKKYQYPFTVFVNPQLMAEAPHQYMNWDQLRELQRYGAQIANHSNSHWHMTWRNDAETETEWLERVRHDVVDAQQQIDKQLGPQAKHFAYPYGEYNAALQTMLEEEGFIAFAQHSGPWGVFSPDTAIPRFPASAQYASLDSLATKLKSLALPVDDFSPQQALLEAGNTTPTFSVTLAHTNDFNKSQMTCFAGADAIAPTWQDNTFTVTLKSAVPLGRSRVNCTVPSTSQNGRFYWYSHPFIRADENGRWPD